MYYNGYVRHFGDLNYIKGGVTMEKYTCKNCNNESKVQRVWSDQMTIEGTLYYIENSKCEHCNEITTVKKIKLT